MKTITLEMLTAKRACDDQVELFKEFYGDAVSFGTEAEALAEVETVADLFDWNWAAHNLLSDQARVEYLKVRDQARVEYLKVRDQARTEYLEVRAQAWVEYEKVRAVAFMQAWFNDQ